MKLRPAMLVLALSSIPLAGTTQTLPSLVPATTSPLVEQLLAIDPAGQPMVARAAPVLPIWSGANGQLLAVVALPRGWGDSLRGPDTPGPAAWRLAEDFAGAGGMTWRFANGLHLDAMLAGFSPVDPVSFCPAATGCADQRTPRLSGAVAGMLGAGITFGDSGLDLSYGLSWLQTPGKSLQFSSIGAGVLPALALPDAPLYALGNEAAMFARGRWRFEQGASVDISASYGRGQFAGLGASAPAVDLDQLSLSLGLDAGSLRGAIVGHVLSSDDPVLAGKRWTTLDLGVSWRTPWSGELSVGAQNLWSAPLNSVRDNDSQARTPYIQYRQDL
jgi:hypothetical protein